MGRVALQHAQGHHGPDEVSLTNTRNNMAYEMLCICDDVPSLRLEPCLVVLPPKTSRKKPLAIPDRRKTPRCRQRGDNHSPMLAAYTGGCMNLTSAL